MESLLVNTLSQGDTVLAVNSGKFGERWIDMAKTYGVHVDELKITWGDAVSADIIAEKLKDKAYKAVLTQACETSTGVLHPIEKIGDLVKGYPNTLLLVDAITALGAVPLPMDEWHIDGLVGGSQKAFMLPTGMSFVSFSKKAQATFASSKIPKFYLDIKKEIAANSKGETFFSSNVTLTKALNFVLAEVEKQGLDSLFKSIQRRADFTAEMIQLLGLKSYAKAKSASLTAVVVPESIDGQKLRELIETDFNLTLMGGQDQAKGKIVRIGHMGYILDEHLNQLATALYRSLEKMGYTPTTAFETYTQKLSEWVKTH